MGPCFVLSYLSNFDDIFSCSPFLPHRETTAEVIFYVACVWTVFVCLFVIMFVLLATLHENGYSRHHEYFRIVGQWLQDKPSKFAG